MKWFHASLVALSFAVLTACGGGSPITLTQENLDRVQKDMSAAEVKTILGAPTESKSEPIPVVGGTKDTYVYRNENSRVEIVLKNDKVQSKEGTFAKPTPKP